MTYPNPDSERLRNMDGMLKTEVYKTYLLHFDIK